MFFLKTILLMNGVLILFSSSVLGFSGVEDFEKDLGNLKVLVFLSEGCPCSRSHVEHLNALSLEFKDVSFYGVITDSWDETSKERIHSYFDGSRFLFPVIFDREQKLLRRFGALKTPHVTLLQKSKNGDYKALYQGGVSSGRRYSKENRLFLKENLQTLRAGVPLAFKAGKSLGCYIRRI